MPETEALFCRETFAFFGELGKHNRTQWMHANRARYEAHVVAPFRRLLAALTPTVKWLNPLFDTSGRTGANFSRINRDTRFSRDKSTYHTHMYLIFSEPAARGQGAGQLYVGVSADAVTAGFRIYGDRRKSPLALVTRPRAAAGTEWLRARAKKLGRKYESYWYFSEKGEWVKQKGWPVKPEEWQRLEGWIVRRKMTPADALKPGFVKRLEKIFADLVPLWAMTSAKEWRP